MGNRVGFILSLDYILCGLRPHYENKKIGLLGEFVPLTVSSIFMRGAIAPLKIMNTLKRKKYLPLKKLHLFFIFTV